MRRIGAAVGAVLVVLGVFWCGRESTHGVGALWDHWWCPLPVVFVFVGGALVVVAARRWTSAP